MTYTCIGYGMFSIAIASLLSIKKDSKIKIWAHDEKLKQETEKEKKFILNNLTIPLKENISIETNLKVAIEESEVIFLLVSSPFFKSIANTLETCDVKEKIIYIGTKGMLEEEPFFYTSFLKKKIKTKYIGAFLGPNLAQDLIKNPNCSMTFSYKTKKEKELIKKAFPTTLHLEFERNSKHMELASVMKNIYAIGSGIFLESTHSKSSNLSFLSLAFIELYQILNNRFFLSYESLPKDIMGDFFLTGTMEESRNFNYGKALVNKTSKEFQEKNTIEGLSNIDAIHNYFKKKKIEAPIFFTIYNIIKEKKEPMTLLEYH